MSTITVSGSSAEKDFTATLRDGGRVELEFAPRAYERLTESQLTAELTAMAERLTSACMEGRRRAAVAKGLNVETEPHWNAATRRFRADRDAIHVRHMAPSGEIKMECTGLRNWSIRVKTGATGRLSESEFVAQVKVTALGLWMQHRRALAEVKREHGKQTEVPTPEKPDSPDRTRQPKT